jgi:hypothetical protein
VFLVVMRLEDFTAMYLAVRRMEDFIICVPGSDEAGGLH